MLKFMLWDHSENTVTMARTGNSLVFLMIVSFVQCSPPPFWTHPPTCYSKVLDMGRDVSARVSNIKNDPETVRNS